MTDDHSLRPERTAETGIDMIVPHVARVWNYWLGERTTTPSTPQDRKRNRQL